jgi:ABC-type transporter lipoprotein component MlaA
MTDINVIIADNKGLAEIYTSLSTRKNILLGYNQMYVKARDLYFQTEQESLAKEVEEQMKEVDERMEIINKLLESIES